MSMSDPIADMLTRIRNALRQARGQAAGLKIKAGYRGPVETGRLYQ